MGPIQYGVYTSFHHPSVGVDTIQCRMNKLGFSDDEIPSASTIKRIVKRQGLKVNKRERYKRIKSKKQLHTPESYSNQ
ncbi:MAG: hypothetical protein C5S47_03300 [Candidatus Methanogasteraceae archaeon]|nr:MAG: hypothetical protein C5S47_03300 [ANME-2 cluster archaeon]